MTTTKETNVAPQWQTFNVVGGMISRNEAGQVVVCHCVPGDVSR